MERINPDRGSYTQRELLPILRVKPHVLRYWEQTLPLIRSGRDDAGRRVWSAGQVRMLMRIRHLVVELGMTVSAAGDALLREAGGETARVKAGLERVRNALVVLLLRVQAGSIATSGLPRTPVSGPERVPVPQPEAFALSSVRSIQLESLVDRGVIPPCPDHPARSVEGPVPLRLESRSQEGRAGSIRLVYSHLFARGEPGRIARTLARLVDHRLSEPGPLVIAAPEGDEAVYRSSFPPDTFVLGVPSLQYGRVRYDAPTLAVLAAIASSRDFDRYIQENGGDSVYLWAADNPHSSVEDELAGTARMSECGVALGLCRGVTGYRLAESASLHLPSWRPRFGETARCGRWLRGPDVPRYILWLRDLARLGAPAVLVSAGIGPSVWRGASWERQVRLLWSEVSF